MVLVEMKEILHTYLFIEEGFILVLKLQISTLVSTKTFNYTSKINHKSKEKLISLYWFDAICRTYLKLLVSSSGLYS